MEDVKVRSNGGGVVPAFLAGLGTGVVLTLLRRHRGAFGNVIGGKVEGEADRMDGRAAVARDEILIHATELGDTAQAVAETLARS